MRKLIAVCTAAFITTLCFAQTLQSPEQFLGYTIGTKYTRHSRIVDYCRAVAQARPDIVKLEKYGETNEGRELITVTVSSPENMQRLEQIRLNNLRLAGLTKDKMMPLTDHTPVIVWLSYNVHGNEPSSSEAAMLTLYALTNPNNTSAKEWLQHTVVIIDPCINPDGRDRYVNWYNSVSGKNLDIDLQAREHSEPWPGGRTNHYNFDLNRDWAWQTQIETQQRLKKYKEWMPQVHVDFHEQGINEPYYFAPAAEPLHEVITPWQREFQVAIGKNNAHYFDSKGWLYFTKERFDLFYPSYGDTYPIYNGAIGMTYEQGGGPRGGLGVRNEDGDSLTLVDRALHHFTTGLSTIEMASKNATQLITEYRKFFDDSRNAKNGEYKTYVVTADEENKITALQQLLDKNGIEYGTVTGAMKGFRYFTGKEEEVRLKTYTLAVSMYQPRSTLVRVLFEPKSKITDSATYDITAWSIPYVYGVEGYALKEKKDILPYSYVADSIVIANSAYGYIIPYTSINSAQLLAYLLKNRIKVRYAEKPFSYNGKTYDPGTLIVIKTSNLHRDIHKIILTAATKFHVHADVVSTGFMDKGADFGSPDVHIINPPHVALITGEQVSYTDAGEVWNFFDQVLDYPITLINANDLPRVSLSKYNVVILPDGTYHSFNDKTIVDKLRDFARGGGRLIAMQNAMALLSSKGGFAVKLKEDKDEEGMRKEDYADIKKYAERERDDLSNSIPGAIYKVELDNTHPLAFGYGNNYYTLKQDANIYEFMKEGWNVGVMKKDAYVAGFSGYHVKNHLKDGLLFGVEDAGNGHIIYMADNPLFRLFWENGKLMFANAVFIVGQ
ncbi:MAG: zinc carboxypeptidase [Bacteroidota bacterium]|nr:zinc carboxypeptidase [Bacteroidota bacterium]